SARDAMRACRTRLENKVSVMIFPEGTRSRSDQMLPFKDGAFRLAIETGVPILPLALHGTRQAIAQHDWRIGPARAVVEVLDPESTEGLTLDDLPALKAGVREQIARARDAVKGCPCPGWLLVLDSTSGWRRASCCRARRRCRRCSAGWSALPFRATPA